MTYIVKDSTAVEQLRGNVKEIRNNFENYAPTDHGLIIEISKGKQKLETR